MKPGGWMIALVAFVVACGQSQDASSQSPEARMNALDARIRAAIGQASCTADAQCEALAVGEKACGGPTQYLPYSTQGTDVKALESLAAQHRKANADFNKASGRMSDCMVVVEPAVACKAGRCVAEN